MAELTAGKAAKQLGVDEDVITFLFDEGLIRGVKRGSHVYVDSDHLPDRDQMLADTERIFRRQLRHYVDALQVAGVEFEAIRNDAAEALETQDASVFGDSFAQYDTDLDYALGEAAMARQQVMHTWRQLAPMRRGDGAG